MAPLNESPVSDAVAMSPRRVQCHLCPRSFTRSHNLQAHLRTHTGERPFSCGVCGLEFTRTHDRNTHQALHSGERKFICGGRVGDSNWGCGKQYARSAHLRRHHRNADGRQCLEHRAELMLLVPPAQHHIDPASASHASPNSDESSMSSLAADIPELSEDDSSHEEDIPDASARSETPIVSSLPCQIEDGHIMHQATTHSLRQSLDLGPTVVISKEPEFIGNIDMSSITSTSGVNSASRVFCSLSKNLSQPSQKLPVVQKAVLPGLHHLEASLMSVRNSEPQSGGSARKDGCDAPSIDYNTNTITENALDPGHGTNKIPFFSADIYYRRFLARIVSALPNTGEFHDMTEDEILTVIIQLGNFYLCAGLYLQAFQVFKRLYLRLSKTRVPDDKLRLVALIQCAALSNNSDRGHFALAEIIRTSEWIEANWQSLDIQEIVCYYSFLQSMWRGLPKWPFEEPLFKHVDGRYTSMSTWANTFGDISAFCSASKHLDALVTQVHNHFMAANRRKEVSACPRARRALPELFIMTAKHLADNSKEFDDMSDDFKIGHIDHEQRIIFRMALFLFSKPNICQHLSVRQRMIWRTKCSCTSCLVPSLNGVSVLLKDLVTIVALCTVILEEATSTYDICEEFQLSSILMQMKTKEFQYLSNFAFAKFYYAYDSCLQAPLIKSLSDISTPLIVRAIITGVREQRECQTPPSHNDSTSYPRSVLDTISEELFPTSPTDPFTPFPATESVRGTKRTRSRDLSSLFLPQSQRSSLQSFELLAKRLKRASNTSLNSTISALSNLSLSSCGSTHSSYIRRILLRELSAGKLVSTIPNAPVKEKSSPEKNESLQTLTSDGNLFSVTMMIGEDVDHS